LLFWSSPEAMVLVPAAFAALGVCAFGGPLAEPLFLLQALSESSAAAATVSASA
jgi:hypothetical protein